MVYKKVWSEEHIKEHKRLFNLYKQENVNIDISNYIDLNKRNIFKFINNLKLGNASK